MELADPYFRLILLVKQVTGPSSNGEVETYIIPTGTGHGQGHGGNLKCKKSQEIEANDVNYQKYLLCARHCAQSLGFVVDRAVKVTILTELSVNM